MEDYLEGGLDFPARFGMERHAEQCYVCGREVRNAQRLTEAVRGLPRIGAPDDFEAGVLARVHAGASLPWYRRVWIYGLELPSWKPVLLGASCLVLLGLTVTLLPGRFYWVTDAPVSVRQSPVREPIRPDAGMQMSTGVPTPVSASPFEELVPSPVSTRAGVNSVRPNRARYSLDDEWEGRAMESSNPAYLEYQVPGPDGRPFIMRLPKTIRMQYGPPTDEYFILNVSH